MKHLSEEREQSMIRQCTASKVRTIGIRHRRCHRHRLESPILGTYQGSARLGGTYSYRWCAKLLRPFKPSWNKLFGLINPSFTILTDLFYLFTKSCYQTPIFHLLLLLLSSRFYDHQFSKTKTPQTDTFYKAPAPEQVLCLPGNTAHRQHTGRPITSTVSLRNTPFGGE
jgi:hypothetical protein